MPNQQQTKQTKTLGQTKGPRQTDRPVCRHWIRRRCSKIAKANERKIKVYVARTWVPKQAASVRARKGGSRSRSHSRCCSCSVVSACCRFSCVDINTDDNIPLQVICCSKWRLDNDKKKRKPRGKYRTFPDVGGCLNDVHAAWYRGEGAGCGCRQGP